MTEYIRERIRRLRDHERHAVHDYDDDCEEAADTMERLLAVVKAAQRLVDCEPLRKQGHEFPALAQALAALDQTRQDGLKPTDGWMHPDDRCPDKQKQDDG